MCPRTWLTPRCCCWYCRRAESLATRRNHGNQEWRAEEGKFIFQHVLLPLDYENKLNFGTISHVRMWSLAHAKAKNWKFNFSFTNFLTVSFRPENLTQSTWSERHSFSRKFSSLSNWSTHNVGAFPSSCVSVCESFLSHFHPFRSSAPRHYFMTRLTR